MKLIIDIPEEEYKTLSKLSEKEKVKELFSHYERVIAYGIPYDKVIDKVTELLENEWGYEGMRDDVSRIMKGEEGG